MMMSLRSMLRLSVVFPVGVFLVRTMAWTSSGNTHTHLIENLRRDGVIQSDRVFKALMETDRAHYCKGFPFEDSPQSIGYHATISAPHMHAYALECLKDHLYEGARALDVGSGSGYLTACMARMVGPSGVVVGVEHIPQLVEQSISNVQTDNPSLLAAGGLKLIVGDGRNGHLDHAPYDAIHVGAAAATVPEALLQQLRPGGRLVIPVGSREGGQQLEQYDRAEDGNFTRTPLMPVVYVPLTDRKRQWSGHEL
ncbi:l-isoaspartyl protein carboxyl methyltransferase, like isoform X2 [Leucoraja erinacea]|uniref:l-isoaspartyl protein carboxyl methyltransferase, like isoform X2 n=1 Tax=Leucoraja erinaceus TaxID=7782 RepID=UPI00245647B5|nr:l-isoaspartyl protein carboxyl methyltransferase, like isoform X2 [Leucoraja erinacea]